MELNRKEAIQKALDSYKQLGATRTEMVEFRGVPIPMPVVTISPEVPYLNPNNSRLRAQLKTHPHGKNVQDNPYTPESQALLGLLLEQTEKFGALKQQLDDFDQKEPGVISVDGLLVNGNTRLTAIRKLSKKGFDVAVLPADATDEDFFQIEMSLQLRKLIAQDYTFTNELLLLESALNRTRSEEAAIQAMQWKKNGKKKLKEYLGYLSIIEELRSAIPNLSYSFFDTKAELIRNLYSQYSVLVEHSPSVAEKLKWTRLAAVFLGLNKDEVREIDEDFVEDALIPNLDEEEISTFFAPHQSNVQSDPLDELMDDQESSTYNLRSLAISIANDVFDSSGSISDEKLDSKYTKLRSKMRHNARKIRENRVDEERRLEPLTELKDVTDAIFDLAERIPVLFQDEKFDRAKFLYHAKKTQKAIAQLKDALDRTSGS